MLEYRVNHGKLEILQWYREQHERKMKVINRFEPYFYVEYDANVPNDQRIKEVRDTNTTSLYGEKLKKIVTHYPNDVGKLREFFPKTWEADIPFIHRYMVDKQPEIVKNPRILFFDIETAMGLNVNAADKPIISIACYDNYK